MSVYKEIFYDWTGANEQLFLWIHSIRHPVYDEVMRQVSWLGEHERLPLYLAVLGGVFLLQMLIKILRRTPGKRHLLAIWFGMFLVLGVGYGSSAVLVHELKDYFGYPRPYIALASTGQVRTLEPIEKGDDFRSFPSGHVAFAACIVEALSPLMGGLFGWLGAGLIVLMAWSRIAVGMHFPADVLASVIIVLPLVAMIRWVLYSLLRKLCKIRC